MMPANFFHLINYISGLVIFFEPDSLIKYKESYVLRLTLNIFRGDQINSLTLRTKRHC